MLESVPVHMVTDDEGNVTKITTAGEMFGADFLIESNKIGNAAHQINKRREEAAEKDFVLKWAETIVPLEKGSAEYNAAVAELLSDDSLQYAKRIKLFQEIDQLDETAAKTTFNTAPVEEIFALNQSRHGVKYDEVAVRKELTEALAGIPPELAAYKTKKWQEFATMTRQKRSEASGAYETTIINKKIKEATQLQVDTYYKDFGPLYLDKNLDLSKLDMDAYISNLKPLQQGGAMTYSGTLEDKVFADLTNEINQRGNLDPAEQTQVIVKSITEFNKDKEAIKNMFPLPKVKQKKDQKQIDIPPAYSLGAGDTIPMSRIEKNDYKQFPLFNKESTQKVLKLVMEGNPIPVPMRSAANKYNISPYQLLIDTLEHYKDEEFYPNEDTKNFLLRKGNKLKGLKDSAKGFSPGTGQLSDATNYIAYVLSGTAPKRFIYRG